MDREHNAKQRLYGRAIRVFAGAAMAAAVLFVLAFARPTPAHGFVLGADGVGIDFSLVDLDRHEYHAEILYFAFMSPYPDGRRPQRQRFGEDSDVDGARPVQERQYAANLFKDAIQGVVGDRLYWPECQWLVFDFGFDAEDRVMDQIRQRLQSGKASPFTARLTGQRAEEDERDVVITPSPDGMSVRVGIRTTSRWVGGPVTRRFSVGIANTRSKVHWRLRPLGIQLLSVGFPYTVKDRAHITYMLRDLSVEMEARIKLPEYGGCASFSEADELVQERVRQEVWHEFVQKSFDQTQPRSPVTLARQQEVRDEERAAEAQRRADAEAERVAQQRAQAEKERARDQELATLRAEVDRLKRLGTQPAPAAQRAPAPTPAAKPVKVTVPILIAGYRPDKKMRLIFRCGGQVVFDDRCYDLKEDGRSSDGKYRTYQSTINIQLEEGAQTLNFELEYDYQGGRRTSYDRFTVSVSRGMAPYTVPITESGRR